MPGKNTIPPHFCDEMNSPKPKTYKASLSADFIAHFLCCNTCSAQYCSLFHDSLLGPQEWKYKDKPSRRLCVFSPGICAIALLPTTYLTVPPKPGCISSYLRESSLYPVIMLLVMGVRTDKHVLNSCKPCFLYNANEQCWNEWLPLPVHANQHLCSAVCFFFFPLLICSKLSLPFVGPSCCLLEGYTEIYCLLCSRV